MTSFHIVQHLRRKAIELTKSNWQRNLLKEFTSLQAEQVDMINHMKWQERKKLENESILTCGIQWNSFDIYHNVTYSSAIRTLRNTWVYIPCTNSQRNDVILTNMTVIWIVSKETYTYISNLFSLISFLVSANTDIGLNNGWKPVSLLKFNL